MRGARKTTHYFTTPHIVNCVQTEHQELPEQVEEVLNQSATSLLSEVQGKVAVVADMIRERDRSGDAEKAVESLEVTGALWVASSQQGSRRGEENDGPRAQKGESPPSELGFRGQCHRRFLARQSLILRSREVPKLCTAPALDEDLALRPGGGHVSCGNLSGRASKHFRGGAVVGGRRKPGWAFRCIRCRAERFGRTAVRLLLASPCAARVAFDPGGHEPASLGLAMLSLGARAGLRGSRAPALPRPTVAGGRRARQGCRTGVPPPMTVGAVGSSGCAFGASTPPSSRMVRGGRFACAAGWHRPWAGSEEN